MVQYPNPDFAKAAGIVRGKGMPGTTEQLIAMGYKSLGESNGWFNKPDSRCFQLAIVHTDWTEIVSTDSGMHIMCSITGKMFYSTDSSD